MRTDSDAPFPETIPISDDGEVIDLDEVLTGRGFVTGKSGSGKSNTASVLAEEMLKLDLPMLVVDTDGEYYGLKESFEVLHAGGDERCDVQVDVTDAERLATVALDENVPVVLDVSGYIDQGEAADVVEAVLRNLFHMENTRRKPFLVFVEEVHEWLPQQGGLDDLGELLVQIVKRGRKRGLGVLGLSQRPAAVDKEYITQCDWFVWHRLTWESDVDVVRRFLDGERADQIEDLDDGEAYVVTDWDETVRRVQFRRKETFDAGATPSLEGVSRPDLQSPPVDVAAEFQAGGDPPEPPTDETPDADDADETASSASTASTADATDDGSGTASGTTTTDDATGTASGTTATATDDRTRADTAQSTSSSKTTRRRPRRPRTASDEPLVLEAANLLAFVVGRAAALVVRTVRRGGRGLRRTVARGRRRVVALLRRGRRSLTGDSER